MEAISMTKRKLFLILSVAMLVGAIVQKSVWGGAFSFSLITMGLIAAWCSYKSED